MLQAPASSPRCWSSSACDSVSRIFCSIPGSERPHVEVLAEGTLKVLVFAVSTAPFFTNAFVPSPKRETPYLSMEGPFPELKLRLSRA